MPKRKRRDKQPTTTTAVRPAAAPEAVPADEVPVVPAAPVAIDPAVALFAQRHREGIEQEKAAQRARGGERHKAGEHDRLVGAKAAAVAAMKRLNRASSATTEQRAEAEATYRTATADLIAHETGERPTWAPEAEAEAEAEPAVADTEAQPDPADDHDASGEPTGDDEADNPAGPGADTTEAPSAD